MQRKTNGLGPRVNLSQRNNVQRRIVQPKFSGRTPVETRPAPPVYRPQPPAVSNPAPGGVMQRKVDTVFRSETRPAPAVYKPTSNSVGVQAKPVDRFRLETRPAPPIYRPQATDLLAQAKTQTTSVQPQSQYELSPAVWIGQGRQQIRIKAKGSPTSIGSVDVHFKQPGKAFISDLEVAQAHRKHGLGSMLMKAALDSARRHGSTATMLEANPGPGSISKQALVSMYQKLGFKNTGMSHKGNPMMTVQGKMSPPNPTAVVQPKLASIFMHSPNVIQRAQLAEEEQDIVTKMEGMDALWAGQSLHLRGVEDQPQNSRGPFAQWLFKNGAAPKKMNCWEAVLYAAFLSGMADKEYIKWAIHIPENYKATYSPRFAIAMLRNAPQENQVAPSKDKGVEPAQLKNKNVPRGNVVLFGKQGEHVALSTGAVTDKGHEILELDKHSGGIATSTIEANLEPNHPYALKVTWGPMPTLQQLQAVQ